jgi:hypothetical protein
MPAGVILNEDVKKVIDDISDKLGPPETN